MFHSSYKANNLNSTNTTSSQYLIMSLSHNTLIPTFNINQKRQKHTDKTTYKHNCHCFCSLIRFVMVYFKKTNNMWQKQKENVNIILTVSIAWFYKRNIQHNKETSTQQRNIHTHILYSECTLREITNIHQKNKCIIKTYFSRKK